MTGLPAWCKWTDATYPNRYCNLQARPDDDLCTTHRGVVDAELRVLDKWLQKL